jgi:hypothetical protein
MDVIVYNAGKHINIASSTLCTEYRSAVVASRQNRGLGFAMILTERICHESMSC